MATKICANCGNKIGIFGSMQLRKNTYICKSCCQDVPSKLKDSAKLYWDLNDLKAYKKMRKDIEIRRRRYKKSSSLGDFSIDVDNNLFMVGQDIYPVEALSSYGFSFIPEKTEHGFFTGDRVLGNILFEFCIEKPYIKNIVVIKPGVYANAKNIGGKIVYDNPLALVKTAEAMSASFSRCKEKRFNIDSDKGFYNRETKSSYGEYSQSDETHKRQQSGNARDDAVKTAPPDKYLKAKMMFMFDESETYTEQDLKKRRNKLLKVFHPDEGEDNSEYARKINDAYNELKKHVTT